MRLPVDQAARLLHIRLRYIDALEQGRLNELPGLAYTRGYLQAYASFLGLDKEEVLRRFEEVESQLARKHIYFPQVFSKEKTPNHYVIWGGLAFALLAYSMWVALVHPPVARISMVEVMQPIPQKQVPFSSDDVVCLQTQDGYYPTCTWIKERVDFLPLQSQAKTIAQMAMPETPAAEEPAADAPVSDPPQ